MPLYLRQDAGSPLYLYAMDDVCYGKGGTDGNEIIVWID